MAGILAKDKSAAVTAADANGFVTVASTAGFYARTRAYISKTGQPSREVDIFEIVSATQMRVRFTLEQGTGPHYGGSDVSLYAGGDGKIDMPAQLAFNPSEAPLS